MYIETESEANEHLRQIDEGDVGLDTEFTDRRPTREEHAIYSVLPGGANRKAAILGWQIVELAKCSGEFPVAWDNIGLRLIQIATDDTAIVLDMWKIRGRVTSHECFDHSLTID